MIRPDKWAKTGRNRGNAKIGALAVSNLQKSFRHDRPILWRPSLPAFQSQPNLPKLALSSPDWNQPNRGSLDCRPKCRISPFGSLGVFAVVYSALRIPHFALALSNQVEPYRTKKRFSLSLARHSFGQKLLARSRARTLTSRGYHVPRTVKLNHVL